MQRLATTILAATAFISLTACGPGATSAPPEPDTPQESNITVDLNSEKEYGEWLASHNQKCEAAENKPQCTADLMDGVTVTIRGPVVSVVAGELFTAITVAANNPLLRPAGMDEEGNITRGESFFCMNDVPACAPIKKGDTVSIVATYEYTDTSKFPPPSLAAGEALGPDLLVTNVEIL